MSGFHALAACSLGKQAADLIIFTMLIEILLFSSWARGESFGHLPEIHDMNFFVSGPISIQFFSAER